MSYIVENNSTNIPLAPYQSFVGKSNLPDSQYITIACSFNIDQPGTLTFLHAFKDVEEEYHSFGDEFSYTPGSHSRQVARKGKFFRVKFQNGDTQQTVFNLFTRVLTNLNDDLNVSLNKEFDSVTVFSEEITAIKNTLEGCITGLDNNILNVYVTNPSGGSASNVQIFDSVGNTLLSDGSGKLQVVGTFDIGLTNYSLEENGHLQSIDEKLDIVQGLTFLNNKLLVDTSITGYSTSALQTTANTKLDDIKTAIDNKHLSSATDSITVNTISGFSTSALQTTANTKLDDIKTSIDNKHLDASTDSITVNLITGFATSALQTTANTKLDNIKTSIDNKHLSAESDSVGVSGNVFITNSELTITGLVFPTSFEISSLPDVVVSTLPSVVISEMPYLSVLNDSVGVSGNVFITNDELTITGLVFPTSFEISSLPDVVISEMPHLSAELDSVGVSGNVFIINTELAKEAKQDIIINELEKVVNKTGDIVSNIYYDDGAVVWADSTPTPQQNPLNPNGWAYVNAEAGNSINLYYFNGDSEIKTLNQCVGQYAVVTNLSTLVNNSLILAVYTKGTPFFTTRITHSPISGVNMAPGGKYLVYWGAVDDNIYPELPRLNFSYETTTGPGLPGEEILSVSLNTNSSEPAGSVIIFIESLGVVFSDGSVNQSRVYNLLSNNTEYTLELNSYQKLSSIDNRLDFQKTNNALDTYITNNLTITNTSFEISNFPTEQNCFITNTEPINISGTVDIGDNIDVNITNTEPISIIGTVDINNFPLVQQVAFDSGVTINNFPLVQQVAFDSGVTINNFPSSTNSRTLDASGNNITSTDLLSGKRGLDIAAGLFGYSTSGGTTTRTALTCDVSGKLEVVSNTKDYLGNGISSTTTSVSGGATNSLDTASSLYVSNGTARTALTATGSSLNTNITNTVPVSGTVAFSNTSIDSHLYAYYNTNLTELHCGAQGGLYTVPTDESGHHQNITNDGNAQVSLYDGNNSISSTTQASKHLLDTASRVYSGTTEITTSLVSGKQGLDVYINNSAVPVSGTVSSNIRDGSANPLTSTDTTATQRSLDVASCLYTTDASTRSALTSTTISAKRALDVNVSNSGNIGVSVNNASLTVNDTTSQGYLNTINQAIGYSYIESTPLNNVSVSANSQYGTYGSWTRGQYKRTVFNYTDANTANTGYISIYCKNALGGGVMIASFYPYTVASARQYSAILDLSPFNSITVYNGSGTTITGVTLTLFST